MSEAEERYHHIKFTNEVICTHLNPLFVSPDTNVIALEVSIMIHKRYIVTTKTHTLGDYRLMFTAEYQQFTFCGIEFNIKLL